MTLRLKFKIEHFLHLNRVERKKVILRYIIRFNKMEKVRLPCVQRYSVNVSYERMLRHRSALKKSDLSHTKKKKNYDCADITKINHEKIQKF